MLPAPRSQNVVMEALLGLLPRICISLANVKSVFEGTSSGSYLRLAFVYRIREGWHEDEVQRVTDELGAIPGFLNEYVGFVDEHGTRKMFETWSWLISTMIIERGEIEWDAGTTETLQEGEGPELARTEGFLGCMV